MKPMTTVEENPLALRVRRISRVLYVLLAAAVFAGDQITKAAVEKSIPLHATVRVIPHFFNLTYTHNPGAAFGLFADSPSPSKTAILIAVSVALLVAVAAIVWKSVRLEWEAGVALALIVGGAASNLLDRVRFERVTDFLDFYFRQYHWFTFNLADSAIVIGAFLLVIHLLAPRGHEN
ncbi:MAG: signal peptidase II [Terriglobia bacterium]